MVSVRFGVSQSEGNVLFLRAVFSGPVFENCHRLAGRLAPLPLVPAVVRDINGGQEPDFVSFGRYPPPAIPLIGTVGVPSADFAWNPAL